MAEVVVIDASAMVDLLASTPLASAVAARLDGAVLHAPAHFDAEVLSALGRLHRARDLPARTVRTRLTRLTSAPIERHPLPELVLDAWARRANLRLVDALYVALAEAIEAPLVTTDAGLAAASSRAELVG
jgi:predicted nucleic acid-binding protein